MVKRVFGILCLAFVGSGAGAQDDVSDLRARFEGFHEAWKARDMNFIRDFYAHDPEMLLFFERRQLRGWDKVETLYENMFANALPGSVESTYTNVDVRAEGKLGYVAANFHLQVTNPRGEQSTDSGRMSVVFEKRDGRWVVVHRHTSFQAPPGPQRSVALHTEPGPLWNPTLEGVWKTDSGSTLLATASYLASSGLSALPRTATYRLADEGLWVTPEGGGAPRPRLLELARLTASELVLRLPKGAETFRRVE